MTKLRSHQGPWQSAVLMVLLLVILVGCNKIDTISAPTETPVTTDKVDPEPLDPRLFTMEFLDQLWRASNHDDWDVLTAVIDPVRGTTVRGTPDSWPEEYVFGAHFPAHCLESTEPFTFTLSVPRFVEGDLHPPVYLLEPHGLEFLEPVTLQFCYPPWYSEHDSYVKFHFWPHEEGPPNKIGGKNDHGNPDTIPVYYMSDVERLAPTGENPHVGLIFETNHFSRWGMTNGDGGNQGLTFNPRNQGRPRNNR